MYSQNNEEEVILKYFGDYVGTLLSIGENDGVALSNTRQMILNGWTGYLVEPSPSAFQKLKELYIFDPNVVLFNEAIASEIHDALIFWESGSHLGIHDVGLLSTLSPIEKARWRKEPFTHITVPGITPQLLIERIWLQYDETHLDFITIDAEGYDYFIAENLDFTGMGTRCICIEYNGKDADKFCRLITPQGFQLIHQNSENLIFAHH